uniref:Uncharacterized protein n=1 Tax=Oryza punctata TaxID=4537 RepID=A0A0E0MPK8_ORYPU
MDLLFLLYRPRPSRRRVALPAAACRRGAHTLLRRFLPPPARRNCSQLSPLLPPPPNRGYFSSGIRIFLGRRLARDGDAIGVSGGGWSRPTVGWIDGREEGVIGGSDHASKFLSGTGCSGVQISLWEDKDSLHILQNICTGIVFGHLLPLWAGAVPDGPVMDDRNTSVGPPIDKPEVPNNVLPPEAVPSGLYKHGVEAWVEVPHCTLVHHQDCCEVWDDGGLTAAHPSAGSTIGCAVDALAVGVAASHI